MSEIATRTPQSDRGMQLGVRRKPQLRLALGYRDEHRKGAPVKTDYFIPHGNDAAVAKFVRHYGETPRAIDIRLPGSLGQFLEIKHVAFAGGQNGEGGILKAVGHANFSLEGVRGGPDVLTVFDVIDGKLSVQEVEIDGVDDPAAQRLGVYLGATVTFGIPDVLGLGGICQVATRGKESIDTLWENAADIYGQLGALATIVLRPKLILKESKMLTPTGGRAQVFVLDLYVPESWDEIMLRAREYRELMPARARVASELMYGRPLEIEAPQITEEHVEALRALQEDPQARATEPVDAALTAGADGDGQQAAGAPPSPAPAAPDPGEHKLPRLKTSDGKKWLLSGWTIQAAYADERENFLEWARWALASLDYAAGGEQEATGNALRAWAAVHAPELVGAKAAA